MSDFGYGPASGGYLLPIRCPLADEQRHQLRLYRKHGHFRRLTMLQRVTCLLFIGSPTRWPINKRAIANILGCSDSNVHQIIRRAIDSLHLANAGGHR